MASIMTNASALTALQSLNTTNKNLEMTQARISTGYRVATASDNAAYWSIATTMRSDKSSLSVVQDALGLGAGKVDTAYSGMKRAIDLGQRDQGQAGRRDRRPRRPQPSCRPKSAPLQSQLKMGRRRAPPSPAPTAVASTPSAATLQRHPLDRLRRSRRDSAGTVTVGTIAIKRRHFGLHDRHQAV